MLSLKLATKEDTNNLIPILHKLFLKSVYRDIVEWDVDSVKASLIAVLEKGVIILLCHNANIVGLVGASYVEHLFNRNHKTAVELAFWIDEEFRNKSSIKKILGAYRYWAKKVGCHSILMGKLKNKNEVETYTIRKLK